MEQTYSNEELIQIGKDNYQTLVCHCLILQTEGYWTEPKKLLKQSILEHLNLYVQSILISYQEYCDEDSQEMWKYIMHTPHENVIGINMEEQEYGQVIQMANKFLAAPPVLLQLFSYHDERKETNLTSLFMDTLLNMILAMAHLNQRNGQEVAGFLQDYYSKVACFLNKDMCYLGEVDERYLFRMTCLSSFRKGYNYVEKDYLRRNNAKGISDLPNENIDNTKIDQKKVSSKDDNNSSSTKAVAIKEEAKQPKLTEEEVAKAIQQAKQEMEAVKEAKRAAVLDGLLERLNGLVGLAPVKKEMQSLVNVIKVRKMRQQHNLPQMDLSYHMVFTGNPGTGKTTVARLVAEIYKELGVLSKGTLVETDRAGLVAGFIGQTAIKVKEVVEKAKGGILFIDEAYALSSRDTADDYGAEAIETLVKLMEDNRNDLVVIVAGYKEEMEHFLKSNTGLVSRFNKFIDFEDYNNEELVAILKVMAADAAMEISEDAITYLHEKLSVMEVSAKQSFGNARGIRNVFEKLVTNQANRIVTITNPTVEQLSEICMSDVDGVLD